MGIGLDKRSRIRETPLFKGVPDSTIGLLAEAGASVSARVGETLWPKGRGRGEVLLLLDGWVGVEALTPDGGRLLLRVLGPDEVIGPVPREGGMELPISAVALTECIGLTWRTEAWERTNGHARALLANLVETQARYINELERRCLCLSGDTVERRLARILLDLCRSVGRSTEGGVEIGLPLRREDLAGLVGSTTCTVSRTMSRWQRAGWIGGTRKRVVVSKRGALARVAGEAYLR